MFLSLRPLLVRATIGALVTAPCACQSDQTPANDDPRVTASPPDASSTSDQGWNAVFEDLDAPLLSVWGPSGDRAFFVGEHGLVIERDGNDWLRWDVPTEESLWWVWGRSPRDVYAGGESGTVLHLDGDRWRSLDAGLEPDETVWGIWGSGEVVWLVGGRARTNGPGFVVRGDADGWVRLSNGTLPNLYKVWGRTAEEVYVVGAKSSLYALTDNRLQEVNLGGAGESPEPLFTVSGNADGSVFAVGGAAHALAFELGAAGFAAVPFETSGLNGVSVSDAGDVVVVGLFGAIRERIGRDWLEHDLFINRHYHAAMALDDGAYAVGGDLLVSGDERRGLIVARGQARPDANPVLQTREATKAEDAGTNFVSAPDAAGSSSTATQPEPRSPDAGSAQPPVPHPDAASPTPVATSVGDDAGRVSRDAGYVMDAGSTPAVDAAVVEVPEAGSLLPAAGETCTDDVGCQGGLECWFFEGDLQARCVARCSDASDCSLEYGDNPTCSPPGCQTTVAVCQRDEWTGCF